MPPSPRQIFLIGFMGAGKTTLGRALEARLPGWRYIDLDEEIERGAGMSVPKIFALYGEKQFRRMERRALEGVLDRSRVIVGCGGGTPCFFDNMELMNRSGRTVLLRARNSTLLRRLLAARDSRPKLRGFSPEEIEGYIVSAQAERDPHYSLCRATFPSDLLENAAEIEASCRLFLRRFLPGETVRTL